MEESDKIDNLLSAREILKTSIEKSRNIAMAVEKTGSRLDQTRHNLAYLQAGIKDLACRCAVYEIKDHVDRTIGPAAGVLKILDLVYELHDLLDSDPRADGLSTYLTNIKRLQEALKLLADNCRLVIMWLEDVVLILQRNAADHDDADDRFLIRVARVVRILVGVQSFCQDGGFLSAAFRKMEDEYRRMLRIEGSSFPEPVLQEMQGLAEVLAANNRLEKCISIYAEARIAKARASLQARNAEYSNIKLSEMDSVKNVEVYLHQWDKDMEFAVRDLLQKEYKLCSQVYHKLGSDVWMKCFAKIAADCGFLEIFGFGISVCNCKKEAIKLLSLLKIFATLDKLRLEFNELFDGKFCVKIQNQTRALVKKVVHNACEIFWELLPQVELQRASNPPLDGSVPKLVRFVTSYCNQLLEEENRCILTRVLEIYQVWNGLKFEDGLLDNEIHSLIKAVDLNLETWSQSYDDTSLSYLFMMNNHWYLCNSTRGTKLGELVGDSWMWAYEESMEYYAGLYMRESWEKLLVLLREEGLILFPGGRAVDRNLVKERIRGFCEAFDEMYRKQSKWILYDKALRWKTRHLIIEAIVLPYKSYVQRFMQRLEYDSDMRSHVKYTSESLENMIGLLFEQKIGKYGGSKCTDLIGIKNGGMNCFSSTPAAA